MAQSRPRQHDDVASYHSPKTVRELEGTQGNSWACLALKFFLMKIVWVAKYKLK